MQIRSLMASTAPNAQHDPQVLWSLTSLMDSQLGQASAEKNSSGMSLRGSTSLSGNLRCSGVSRVPIKFLTCSLSIPSKQWLWPAFQVVWRLLTWSMIDLKSMKVRSFLARAETASTHSTRTVASFIKQIIDRSNITLLLSPNKRTIIWEFKGRVIHHYTAFYMRVLQPSPNRKNKDREGNREVLSLGLSSSFQAVAAKKMQLGISPLAHIEKIGQIMRKEHSSRDGIQSIKEEIHKLRTESPQFTGYGLGQHRSKSFFFDHPTKIKRIQDAKPLQIFMKMTYKRRHRHHQNKSHLPELSISQAKRTNQKVISLIHSSIAADKSNVILLKRDMRYRLQKLPQFSKSQQLSDKQPNLSLTGWNRNPQDLQQEFSPERVAFQ